MKNKGIHRLFPCAVFESHIEDLSICDRLEDSLRKLKLETETISNVLTDTGFIPKGHMDRIGYVGKTVWQSGDILNELPQFEEICKIFIQELKDVFKELSIIYDDVYINNMWGNIASSDNKHDAHTHPNSYYSGIFYIKTPKNCAKTFFHSPIEGSKVICPDVSEFNDLNIGKYHITPEEGKLIIFPSWLLHSVDNLGEYPDPSEDRITLAFTVMIKADIKLPTRKLKY